MRRKRSYLYVVFYVLQRGYFYNLTCDLWLEAEIEGKDHVNAESLESIVEVLTEPWRLLCIEGNCNLDLPWHSHLPVKYRILRWRFL